MASLGYSTVIVTRNRDDALSLSLPLHIKLTRLPEAIFVIDSSDDPSANQELVKSLSKETPVDLRHICSPAGMTVQRNIGLAMVKSPVVFFPDDDSLVYPDAMAEIMRVYERDHDCLIGGVCSAEAKEPPQGVLAASGNVYQMRMADKLRAKIAHYRYKFEELLFRDPFHLSAQLLWGALPPLPHWLGEINAVPVNWMTGFRMSFRTEVIRKSGFEESLGRYALFEDTDASLSVLKSHMIIGAQRAKIYHHKAPARRAGGQALGAMQILNRAYVIARSGVNLQAGGKAVLRAERRFSAYKCAQYLSGANSHFGYERLRGALAARKVSKKMLSCPQEKQAALYIKLRQKILGQD